MKITISFSSWKDFFSKCPMSCSSFSASPFLMYSGRNCHWCSLLYVTMIINIVRISDSAYVKHINIYLITCLVGYVFYKPLTAYLNMSESVFKYVRRPSWCLLCSLVVLPLTSRSFTPFFQCGAQVPPVLLAAGSLCGE